MIDPRNGFKLLYLPYLPYLPYLKLGETSGAGRVPFRVLNLILICTYEYQTSRHLTPSITMDSSNGAADTESQSLAKTLRLALKEWEQSFAATHQGRKAGREDIKQHPEIGQRHSLTTFLNQLLI